MMYEKKRYVVHILDEEYTLISDETESLVLSASKQVDTLMKDILNKLPSTNVQRVAVLAALRIASDLLKVQVKKQEDELTLDACIREIDQALF